jgi:hypothetical protein
MVKVGGDAAAEIQGLADIEDGSSNITKQIDPRTLGEFC